MGILDVISTRYTRWKKLKQIRQFRSYNNRSLYELNRILYFLNKTIDKSKGPCCKNCGEELRGLKGAPTIPTHLITESRLCSSGKYPETLAKWDTPKETNNRKLNV